MEGLSVEEIRKLAERVAADKLAPRASEIDRNPTFPWDNICALREAEFNDGRRIERIRVVFQKQIRILQGSVILLDR